MTTQEEDELNGNHVPPAQARFFCFLFCLLAEYPGCWDLALLSAHDTMSRGHEPTHDRTHVTSVWRLVSNGSEKNNIISYNIIVCINSLNWWHMFMGIYLIWGLLLLCYVV
jgi:hypothetical protein